MKDPFGTQDGSHRTTAEGGVPNAFRQIATGHHKGARLGPVTGSQAMAIASRAAQIPVTR